MTGPEHGIADPAEAARREALSGLPKLRGTSPQIAWAEDIRGQVFDLNPTDPALRKSTRAKFWIDNKYVVVNRAALPRRKGSHQPAVHAGTPTRLPDETWGVRVIAQIVHVGDILDVTSKSGKSWREIVSRLYLARAGVFLCAGARFDGSPDAASKLVIAGARKSMEEALWESKASAEELAEWRERDLNG